MLTLRIISDILFIITNRNSLMNPTLDLEVLTTQDLSKMFGVSERTIYRKVEDKQIPFFRLGKDGSIRFLKSRILQWIDSQHKNT